jgi:hypothetical protein
MGLKQGHWFTIICRLLVPFSLYRKGKRYQIFVRIAEQDTNVCAIIVNLGSKKNPIPWDIDKDTALLNNNARYSLQG